VVTRSENVRWFVSKYLAVLIANIYIMLINNYIDQPRENDCLSCYLSTLVKESGIWSGLVEIPELHSVMCPTLDSQSELGANLSSAVSCHAGIHAPV